MFRDYRSTFDDFKRQVNGTPHSRQIFQHRGVDIKDFESVYKAELNEVDEKSQPFAVKRLRSELHWYRLKRPYFNVYPLVERKLLEIDSEIDIAELKMPYEVIEIRTQSKTILVSDELKAFSFVYEFANGEYCEFLFFKNSKVKSLVDSKYVEINEPWIRKGSLTLSMKERIECVLLAAGTCMLANDSQIIKPIILNKHYRENMTPAEIAAYAEKAINRTGRVGFEFGKDIERMKATVHYRNGCFAKYYVGRDHELYPRNAEASKVPIIKWRCGSVVNKDNVPKVPTGFKDFAGSQKESK